MKNIIVAIILLFAINTFADGNKTTTKPIIKNKVTNPNYDPNKGLLGKPKEETVEGQKVNELSGEILS